MLSRKMKLIGVVLLCATMLVGVVAGAYAQDNNTSIEALRKAADQGDANAQIKLGIAYHDGAGVEKDDKEAANLLRKAVDQGNVVAKIYLKQYHYAIEDDARMRTKIIISLAIQIAMRVVLLICCISFIVIMRKHGSKKYGLQFFLSKQFLMAFLGAIFLSAFLIEKGLMGGWRSGYATVILMTALALYIGACYVNIKRCNAVFGIFYTLTQMMTVMLFL